MEIRNLARKLLAAIGLSGKVRLLFGSNFLTDLGWYKSYSLMASVDRNDNPIPWYTYSFYFFLREKVNSELEIFEYGCGNSTIWFERRVRAVHAVEHDRAWIELLMRSLKSDQTKILFRPLDKIDEYISSISDYGKKYDIVVVDGRQRVACAEFAFKFLKERAGVLILDNSDRAKYRGVYDFYQSRGYSFLEFWGPAPGVSTLNCTTIFYVSGENCLSI